MRLIHLTDPHLSSLDDQRFFRLRGKRRSGYLSWYRNRRHVHRREILERLTTAIGNEEPDQVLLTGDLVHIGLECEMIEAAGWLERLGPPEKVLLIPGNHDNYAEDSLGAMFRHWGAYLPRRDNDLASHAAGYPVVREAGQIRIVGLNSSCTTRIFSAAGELGQKQLNRLDHHLAGNQADRNYRVVLIHHPPLPGLAQRRKALRDDRALRELLAKHSPDLVLYGHLHRDREHSLGNTRIYCTASASSAEGASYRVFDLEPNGSGWHCRMRLMSLPADAVHHGDPVKTIEESWSVSL